MQIAKPEYAPDPPPDRDVIGWAVIEMGQIKTRTVSDTRRAAMVNGLVDMRGVMVHGSMTDEMIERMWFHYRQGAEIEMVTITRTHAGK